MSAHVYNYFCGCSACSAAGKEFERTEAMERAREDAIETRTDALVVERMRDEELASAAIGFVTDEGLRSILDAAGRFVARYGQAGDDYRADHADALYRALQPHVEAYVRELARSDAADEYDAAVKVPWHQQAAA